MRFYMRLIFFAILTISLFASPLAQAEHYEAENSDYNVTISTLAELYLDLTDSKTALKKCEIAGVPAHLSSETSCCWYAVDEGVANYTFGGSVETTPAKKSDCP